MAPAGCCRGSVLNQYHNIPEEPLVHVDRELWQRFAAADSEPVFLDSWLQIQCSLLPGVTMGLVATVLTDRISLRSMATWPPGVDEDREELMEAARHAIEEGRGVAVKTATTDTDGGLPGSSELYTLAYPVIVDGRPYAVAAVLVECQAESRLEDVMRQLQWGASWLELARRRREGSGDRRGQRVAALLDLVAVALEHEYYRSAATAFVTELATRLGCERASLGHVTAGGRVELAAISHTADFNKNMNLVGAICRAMEEAVDQRVNIAYPVSTSASYVVDRHHAELAGSHGDSVVQTFPVSRNGVVTAALTLEYAEGQSIPEDAALLCETAATIVGSLLEDKRLHERPLLLQARDTVGEQLGKLAGPRHYAYKLVAAGLGVIVLFLALATGEHRVTARALLEGEVQRAVVAPFDGYIATSARRAGDTVTAGQELGSLDSREYLLQKQNLLSQRAQLSGEYRRALASHDRVNITIQKARIDQIDAQLSLVNEKLQRTTLVAPFDGIIVTGDLSQSLGATVERGQVLFEVAPLSGYRVILQVDERDIAEVRGGQSATLVLSALPETRFDLVLTRITSVSKAEEGGNYFRVEAGLKGPSDRLRPGMAGIGKVSIGRKRLLWIWTHRMVEWLRSWFWTWLP